MTDINADFIYAEISAIKVLLLALMKAQPDKTALLALIDDASERYFAAAVPTSVSEKYLDTYRESIDSVKGRVRSWIAASRAG